jgi:hypothetical protein
MAARRKLGRRPPSRRSVPAARPSFSGEVHENNAGRWYTSRWHRVAAWAEDALALGGYDEVGEEGARVHGGSYYRRAKDSARVEQRAVARVRDLTDAEEAYERGLPLESLDAFPEGPGRDRGGQRRVVVTALTWVPDHEGEVCYDPAWVTLGHGMTARTAAAAAARFVRAYEQALAARVVSRELWFTALEIKFWTAPHGTDYV